MTTDLIIALLIMGVGLLGAILPFLPGPTLVWLGALYYSWRTNWVEISPWTLLALLVVALLASTADLWMSYLGSRQGGAHWMSSLAGLVAGLVGLFLFSLPGMLIGAVAAILAVEYHQHGSWTQAWQAGKGYLAGYLVSLLVQLGAGIVMIVWFLLALWYQP